eukprot:GFKZ01000505.1.p1 GENE.GFKZ01000505.1~~GFKZ01000505.1.p1  ORF type:complete len:748 (-),score=100.13 GFKZ01000505.1:1120-3363(-)
MSTMHGSSPFPITITTRDTSSMPKPRSPTHKLNNSNVPHPFHRPLAFIANAVPLVSTLNSSKTRHSLRHHPFRYRCANLVPRITIRCQEEQPSFPEQFDRDYYPKLKAEYADDDQVVIFAKDDYEIDPQDVPWLEEYRGLDLDKIRTDMKSRPPVPGELEGLPTPAMRVSDLHSQEDIDDFEPGFRHHDSVSGNVWTDPMPESDFDGDADWIDFRKFEKEDNDDDLSFLDPPPRKRKQYASYEEELQAVQESADELQAELLDLGAEYQPQTWGEQHPVPDPDDFRKWQQAAAERGGNASQNNSFFLSPAKLEEKTPASDTADGGEDDNGPAKQFPALMQAHAGEWQGKAYLYSVSTGSNVVFTQEEEFEVTSETSQQKGGDLEWTAEVQNSNHDLISAACFKVPEHPDALVPGRAVSADGHFACGSSGITGRNSSDGTGVIESAALSFSQKCLRSLVGNRTIRGELEICMVCSDSNHCRHRCRVILCSSESERRRGKKAEREYERYFSHVLFFSEYRSMDREKDNSATVPQYACRETSTQNLKSLDVLKGKWVGNAHLLHPEFPPLSFLEEKTSFDFQYTSPITLDQVTWVESEIPDTAESTSKARTRTLGKKKTSKRVAAARQHDQRRLSECSFLSEEKVGHKAADTFAWREVRNDRGITGLFSPRTGKFVNDYCGVVLGDRFLVTFPHQNAFPNLPTIVSLTGFTSPGRNRISVARNDSGSLVGVLFVNEELEVNGDETSDHVAL